MPGTQEKKKTKKKLRKRKYNQLRKPNRAKVGPKWEVLGVGGGRISAAAALRGVPLS